MTIAQMQFDALELSRTQIHALNGEDAPIVFERLNDTTNEPEDLFTVTRAFEYGERTFDGAQLPDGVELELRIAESELTASDIETMSTIRQATNAQTIRHKVIRPSQYWPSGMNRFWRFWLAPLEIVITATSGNRLIDDAGNFLIDDAGNSIVWDGI